jgi:hypothetical protein
LNSAVAESIIVRRCSDSICWPRSVRIWPRYHGILGLGHVRARRLRADDVRPIGERQHRDVLVEPLLPDHVAHVAAITIEAERVVEHVAPRFVAVEHQLGGWIGPQARLEPPDADLDRVLERPRARERAAVHVVDVLEQLGLVVGLVAVLGAARVDAVVDARALLGAGEPIHARRDAVVDVGGLTALGEHLGVGVVPLQAVVEVLVERHLVARHALAIALVLQPALELLQPLHGLFGVERVNAGARAVLVLPHRDQVLGLSPSQRRVGVEGH